MREPIALDSTRLQRLQQRPLWDFALTLYAKPGVEAACLTLQDEAGLDVCELLFHCWLYTGGLQARPDALIAERDQRRLWQRQVTDVLRKLRRDLKASAVGSDTVTALRNTIKQAELMAERENLQRWQIWVLASQNGVQRVINLGVMLSNVDNWLLTQLFGEQQECLPEGLFKRPSASLQALQTLTFQLDPYQ